MISDPHPTSSHHAGHCTGDRRDRCVEPRHRKRPTATCSPPPVDDCLFLRQPEPLFGAVAGLPRKNTSPICQPHLQSPGVKAGLPRKTHRPSSQPHPSHRLLPSPPASNHPQPQSPPAPSHRQRGARDHHCPGETRVSTRHPSSLWQCSHSNRRSGPHQLFGNGSRSIGQLMHRGPPRPDPNSEPGMVSTSTPAASRRRLVSTLRL